MVIVGNDWDEVLSAEYEKPYFKELNGRVSQAYASETVFPCQEDIYRALISVPYNGVKVVIIGQDPYHGEGQANGMAFAVNDGVKPPPSLVNIYKEIENDIGVRPTGTTLTGWAKQGVLLLNTVLTVRSGSPKSHDKFGWQYFTDAVIAACSKHPSPLVFILWGANAAQKKPLIAAHHLVLSSAHPSPLSAYSGFFGCKHFSKANAFLAEHGMTPIDWSYTDDITADAGYYARAAEIKRV